VRVFLNQLKANFVLLGVFCLLLMLNGCGGGGGGGDGGGDGGSPTPAASSAKEITSYKANSIAANINQQTRSISFVLPYGSDLSSVDIDFTTTGASVTIGNVTHQISTVKTSYDFTHPMTLRVKARDGSTRDYTATGTVASKTANQMLSYSLKEFPNSMAVIDEPSGTISLTLPYGTTLSSWVANFTMTGTSVTVGADAKEQVSGETANDFSGAPVVYTVHAADGATKTYTIVITIASNIAKDITRYSIGNSEGIIDEQSGTISLKLPPDSTFKSLIANFTTTGKSVTVGADAKEQVSGKTANDFSSAPVVYTVHAADGSTKTYTIVIKIASDTAKDITKFEIIGFPEAQVTIDQHAKTISVVLPYGTDLTQRVASFTATGDLVTIYNGVEYVKQDSGETVNDFKGPVIYTVHAVDGSTRDYTVMITLALNTAKDITSYSIKGFPEAPVTIDEQNRAILVKLPYGTDLTVPRIAIFATTGVTVTDLNGNPQISDVTENKFKNSVTYLITAADGSVKQYTVTVVEAANTQKEINTYVIDGIPATFDGDNITVVLPFEDDITDLTATFTYTGKSIEIIRDGVRYPQQSEITSNNFENSGTLPLEYTVTAADESVHVYHVTVKFNIWTWRAGSSKINQGSILAEEIPEVGYRGVPGGRGAAAIWTDEKGILWMFGGTVSPTIFSAQVLSDLWAGYPDPQNPGKVEWVLKSNSAGVNTKNLYGDYSGQPGLPGARFGAMTWKGKDGALWMLGGYGFARTTGGMLNDLWKLDYVNQGGVIDRRWTWMGGSNEANAKSQYVSKGVESTGIPGARRLGISWTDAEGNLWMFGGENYWPGAHDARDIEYYNDLWKYNINTGKWTWMKGDSIANQIGHVSSNPLDSEPGSRSQSISWVDRAGDLWLFGGTMYIINSTGRELLYNDLWKYSLSSNKWILVKGVTDSSGVVQTQQSGVYGTMGISTANTTPGGRRGSASWVDDQGNLWIFGGEGISSNGNLYYLNDLWRFSVADSRWTWMGGSEFVDDQLYLENRFSLYGNIDTGTFFTRPGSRWRTHSWTDDKGNILMFGGVGYGASSNEYGFLNDFWAYNYK
jgi:hypothetical protein